MRAMKTIGAVVLAVAMGGGAYAGNPAPSKEVKDMGCLVGAWKGTASMTMGADKADGLKVAWTCKQTSSEWGVMCSGEIKGIPGMDTYSETDLFGYEPNTGKYHWYAVTNAGETHDHVANPPKGDTIEFVYDGVQDGKAFKEVIHMTFKGKSSSTMELTSETFVEGKSTSLLSMTARK